MDTSSAQIARLKKQVKKLKRDVCRRDERIEKLEAENRELREQLEQVQREVARQAAPFRRREKKKTPDEQKKRPGRKVGHPGACRQVPEQIDEEVEVPLDHCPQCGGALDDVSPIEQFIEEIPPVRPRVVRVVTYRARCARCGVVHSVHPLQTSRGQGAAKVQLGPRALSIASLLNKHLGLTMRKTCRVLRQLCGLRLTPGGLSQALDRIADRLADRYEALAGDIRGSPAVNVDETSWWVGGPGQWLWVFTTPNETLYRVDSSRGSDVVLDILGTDYAGVLGSDCLSSYDPPDCRKHKCIAHHLRAIKKAMDLPGQEDNNYLNQWKLLFKAVNLVYDWAGTGRFSAADLAEKRGHLEEWAKRLLAEPCSQTGDARVQNRLRKQRPHLLTCLYDLAAEPTNNRAERALRPAVIARKLSCGNKTDRGRITWQTLASLAQTCHQRGQDFVEFLAPRITLSHQGGQTRTGRYARPTILFRTLSIQKNARPVCAVSRVLSRRRAGRARSAAKAICLDPPLRTGSPGPGREAAYPRSRSEGPRCGPLLGLAPGGVCHAGRLTAPAVRSYRTISPLPSSAKAAEGFASRFAAGASPAEPWRSKAVSFLWHCPDPDAPPGGCGARTVGVTHHRGPKVLGLSSPRGGDLAAPAGSGLPRTRSIPIIRAAGRQCAGKEPGAAALIDEKGTGNSSDDARARTERRAAKK